ncbi:MAG TPA: TonB-dependent receptor plug domain-containing protein [Opitutaceae bacterium]|jgi:outer membrane receptor for monomeric catechols
MTQSKRLCTAILTVAALVPSAWAQNATPTPNPSTPSTQVPTAAQTASTPASGEQAVQMEKYQVNDVPIDQVILPNARPFTSVFGTEDNIIDIPRNVTIISREQMDVIDIQDVTEFSKLTSSSYTDSNFGSPANPTIRGQSADVFLNGMRQRIGESGDGMPFDFNTVESVNIVPGPATAVQGASAYVGGFIDMITKQPFFDGFKSSASYTYGSYNTNRWTFDSGGPISPTLAYRFSYSGEDSDGYWYDWIKETTSVYGALTWRPNNSYELFMDLHAFWADYRENFGIDRPTQALISDGLYLPGTNINNGTTAGPGNLQNASNVEGSNTIAFGAPVPIDYRETAQGPASHAHGQEYNAQIVQTLKISTNAKVVNNTMWSYTKRDTFNSDGYSEIVNPAWFIDNRTEFIFSIPKLTVNTGLEEKFQSVNAYDDFFFEPVNVWDLSSKALRADLNYALASGYGGYAGVIVPGWPGRYATPGIINNDTNQSEMEAVSPYFQGTYNLTEMFNIVGGARLDLMHVESRDPFTPNSASVGVGEPNTNLSLVYKAMPTMSFYGTVNYSQNYTGDLGDGGGFGIYSDADGNATLPRGLFSENSFLYEVGTKLTPLDNKLFLSADAFFQTRQNKPQASPAIQYQYYGFEVSGNYQPNKNFFATFGYSWVNGSTPAPAPFQAYATQQLPGGPPDPFTAPAQLTGRLRAPGQPLDTINGLGQYTFDNGFGFEANVLVTSPMNGDYQGYLVIPWQYTLDGSVFYKQKRWEIKLTVNNLTNQHNWTPSDATYAYEGIVSDAGLEVFGKFTYRF